VQTPQHCSDSRDDAPERMVDRYMAQIDLKPLQDKTRVSGAFQVRRVSGEKVRLVVELCVCDTEQRRVLVFYPGLTSVFCRLQVFNANNELAYVNLSLDHSCEANKDIHPTTCRYVSSGGRS